MDERTRLFARPSTWPEARAVTDALRAETVGGALLLIAAAVALAWANSPWRQSYATLRDTVVGWPAVHLDLSLGTWAGDGLLAIFFFVAGLELKRELLVGDLREPAKAAVPVVAALCGVATPAVLYVAVVAVLGGGEGSASGGAGGMADGSAFRGWAVPTATDIAFALAVLAVLGSHLPSGMRSFLLTLAVVDDLVAIVIIATVYTSSLSAGYLALALLPLAAFAALVQRRIVHWWLLVPLAVVTWTLVHASGVHATVAGVLLGLSVPVRPRASVPSASTLPRDADVAERFAHRLRPLSAGFAVPVFAFFAAGVPVVDGGGLGAAVRDPITLAVVVALVVGKLVGVLGSTVVMARLTRADLDDELAWVDVVGLALLCGIGFTVSLLVGELAFGRGSPADEHAKLGVLTGSLVCALLAAAVLVPRNAAYRRVHRGQARDEETDRVPEVHQRDDEGPDRV
ncbi:Na(+)/H(+) antiporter nhaA 1 [Nostocoides japonicum T1-X7]|uniref:Na(+)/H(+) antiporter NhaA n=1 Tax=Nostocoides japonicum T1-X7 TaxID=1194083 RepID=A0A077M1G0_9MICO|nr:Na+/H+ antiporter NhaA [Tetrasphaera japonica]CCH78045.1 Na(+)/H(+) antiporter nhaA 1 [Tetrasphaera japonica T1-X7]